LGGGIGERSKIIECTEIKNKFYVIGNVHAC
jgi:hypothetical protein